MPKTAKKLSAEHYSAAEQPLLPADSENSQLTTLLNYLSQDEIEQVWHAYRYSDNAHKGQVRRSGEPYIMHPVAVACILAKLHLDVPTL